CTSDERQAMDRIRCVPQNCADNEYRNAAEECATCGPQNGINPAENGCIQCTNDLIEHPVTDRCVCPNGEQLMQGTTDMCEPIPCNADQILSGGMCMDCTGGTKPNMGKSICVPNNCANNEIRAADETCRAAAAGDCPVEDEIPQPQNGLRTCTACSDIDQNRPKQNSDGLSCRATIAADCEAQNQLLIGGRCETPLVCADEIAAGRAAQRSALNSATNRCTCQGEENSVLFVDAAAGFCAPPLPTKAANETRYDAADCESAGWLSTVVIDNSYVSERCRIPFRAVNTPPVPVTPAPLQAQSAALQPLQVVNNQTGEFCVLRQHMQFTVSASPPSCADPELFAEAGLPRIALTARMEIYASPTVRITVLRASAAERLAVAPNDRFSFNNQPLRPSPLGGGGGDSKKGEFAIAAGTAAFVGLLVWNYWDGNLAAFSLSPHTSFSHNGRAFHYSYGSRLDFRQDDLSAYWGASQSHAGGETDSWVYFTGIEYGKDFWNISYNSESQGVRTNMDLAAGAEWQRGILSYKTGVATVYNIAEAGEDFTASWRNSLEL
ncbi:MAG: hypothetical protein HAW59_06845, partial [Betaproteobacteria bacterium]|nr:hypothetical protein [Betaproteobacteria bacterium]